MKTIVEKSYDPVAELQRSLVGEAESDPMNKDQEQTWPTQEELEKAQAEQNQIKNVFQKVHRNIKLLGSSPTKKKKETTIQTMNNMYFHWNFFIGLSSVVL